jgi:hypothetical protein
MQISSDDLFIGRINEIIGKIHTNPISRCKMKENRMMNRFIAVKIGGGRDAR